MRTVAMKSKYLTIAPPASTNPLPIPAAPSMNQGWPNSPKACERKGSFSPSQFGPTATVTRSSRSAALPCRTACRVRRDARPDRATLR
jgi:hypothetical protein